MNMKIIKATSKHTKDVGRLFDLYRQFYKYKSNLKASTNFIKQRILKNESTIFICYSKILEGIVEGSSIFFAIGLSSIQMFSSVCTFNPKCELQGSLAECSVNSRLCAFTKPSFKGMSA